MAATVARSSHGPRATSKTDSEVNVTGTGGAGGAGGDGGEPDGNAGGGGREASGRGFATTTAGNPGGLTQATRRRGTAATAAMPACRARPVWERLAVRVAQGVRSRARPISRAMPRQPVSPRAAMAEAGTGGAGGAERRQRASGLSAARAVAGAGATALAHCHRRAAMAAARRAPLQAATAAGRRSSVPSGSTDFGTLHLIHRRPVATAATTMRPDRAAPAAALAPPLFSTMRPIQRAAAR